METLSLPAKISESSDIELSGDLNRAVGEGAKFALMLAMLQPSLLERPALEKSESSASLSTGELFHTGYRSPGLKPSDADWQHLDNAKRVLHAEPQDALLYQVMHPQPLSLFDDAKRIDDMVAFNCDYYTQKRLKAADGNAEKAKELRDDNLIGLDETGLYDILQELDVQPSFAA